MKTALINITIGLTIAIVLGSLIGIDKSFAKVSEHNRALKEERVVIGHRIDGMGNFQLVYKAN